LTYKDQLLNLKYMAKSAAPFLSINPSGSVAGLLTASRWKGRPYLRLLVTPSNPQTLAQGNVRYALGIVAKAARAVLTSYKDPEAVGSAFFIAARDQAPSGQSWISWLQKVMADLVGSGNTADAAYAALNSTQRGYFTTAGTAMGYVDYDPSFSHTESSPGVNEIGGLLFVLAYFASNYMTGDVKTAADLAIAAETEEDVTDFADLVTLSVD